MEYFFHAISGESGRVKLDVKLNLKVGMSYRRVAIVLRRSLNAGWHLISHNRRHTCSF